MAVPLGVVMANATDSGPDSAASLRISPATVSSASSHEIPDPSGIGIALGTGALHRMEDAVRTLDLLGRGLSLRAERAAGRVRRIALDCDEPAVAHHRDAAAPRSAQRAPAGDAGVVCVGFSHSNLPVSGPQDQIPSDSRYPCTSYHALNENLRHDGSALPISSTPCSPCTLRSSSRCRIRSPRSTNPCCPGSPCASCSPMTRARQDHHGGAAHQGADRPRRPAALSRRLSREPCRAMAGRALPPVPSALRNPDERQARSGAHRQLVPGSQPRHCPARQALPQRGRPAQAAARRIAAGTSSCATRRTRCRRRSSAARSSTRSAIGWASSCRASPATSS